MIRLLGLGSAEKCTMCTSEYSTLSLSQLSRPARSQKTIRDSVVIRGMNEQQLAGEEFPSRFGRLVRHSSSGECVRGCRRCEWEKASLLCSMASKSRTLIVCRC